MLFYHWFEQARRIQLEQTHQEAREQGRQELLQRFDQVFAGDKDAMEKRDQIFNGITKKIILLRSTISVQPSPSCTPLVANSIFPSLYSIPHSDCR